MKKFFAMTIFFLAFAAQVSAMNLTLHESVGAVSQTSANEIKITGYTRLDGNFSKGVAVFADKLYLHFDSSRAEDFDAASRFGGEDFSNTVPVYVLEGATKIYPISGGDREFYLLATETGGGGSFKLIGARDGKWVKYFDTLDARKKIPHDFYPENFYAAGDTIIFRYKQWQTENFCELRYKWDAAANWFGVEVVYL